MDENKIKFEFIFKKKKKKKEYPVKSKGLEIWKEASMTEARWPLRTATGSGGGLLLILASTSNEDGVVSFWGF